MAMVVISSRLGRWLGLFAGVLALACRLASGMVAPDLDAGRAAAALLDAMIACQHDAPAGHDPDGSRHNGIDHGSGALAALAALPSPPLAPTATVPAPRGASLAVAASGVVAAPVLLHPPCAAYPRGPPILT